MFDSLDWLNLPQQTTGGELLSGNSLETQSSDLWLNVPFENFVTTTTAAVDDDDDDKASIDTTNASKPGMEKSRRERNVFLCHN